MCYSCLFVPLMLGYFKISCVTICTGYQYMYYVTLFILNLYSLIPICVYIILYSILVPVSAQHSLALFNVKMLLFLAH